MLLPHRTLFQMLLPHGKKVNSNLSIITSGSPCHGILWKKKTFMNFHYSENINPVLPRFPQKIFPKNKNSFLILPPSFSFLKEILFLCWVLQFQGLVQILLVWTCTIIIGIQKLCCLASIVRPLK